MKIEHPLLVKGVGVAGAWLVRRLLGTTRFHFRYADPAANPEVSRRQGERFIYAFFHEMILFPAHYWSWPSMNILVSDHRDGELMTQIVQRLGFTVVRGSSTRGGARALREMTLRIDKGNPCITPDGPRGPRRQVQMGLPYMASRTGLPIALFGMAYQKPWRARSWDRFAVPRPFRPAACVYAEPVRVPPDANRETLETYRVEIERRLCAAMLEAEEWVEHL